MTCGTRCRLISMTLISVANSSNHASSLGSLCQPTHMGRPWELCLDLIGWLIYFSAWSILFKGKGVPLPLLESRRGAHLPFPGQWARRWLTMHEDCDAWPLRRQTVWVAFINFTYRKTSNTSRVSNRSRVSNISRVSNTSRVSSTNRVSRVSIWCQLTTLVVVLSGIIMHKISITMNTR